MSKKIPFLQMFSALRRWAELAQAVEGWLIVSAAIDKATRSAKIVVEGAGGAGSNLIREAEETLARAYGLSSVKITSAPAAPSQPIPEAPTQTAPLSFLYPCKRSCIFRRTYKTYHQLCKGCSIDEWRKTGIS